MKLKELYYRLRFRPPGATAIGIISGNKKHAFDEKLENIAENAKPCRCSNSLVLQYIKSKYGLQPSVLSETEINNYKINYLLSRRPELLSVPEIKFSEKMSRKKSIEFSKQNEKRFEEARNYPFEKLGLELEAFTFDYALEDGFKVTFRIIAENINDNISVGFSVINKTLSEEEEKTLRSISEDITVYKGVTKEDILNRTTAFLNYACALINRERQEFE